MTLHHTTSSASGAQDAGAELGGAVIGDFKDAPTVAWPQQHLRAPLLNASAPWLHEVWRADGPVQQGHSEGIHWRRNADLLYGVIELHENDCAASETTPLQSASRLVYERLFGLLRAQDTPHLWRVWNYLGRINGESHGLERYRQFNQGRFDAFVQAQRDTGGQVPAACALGVADGPLSVAFLAGISPLVPLENPRQVSAWRYPAQYGPRAPTFSRAALAYPRGQEALFISGTASIVGHETVHPGDVAAQCLETVRNLECIVLEANRLARSAQPFSLEGLGHRVYVRHAGDADTVQRTLQPLLRGASVVCVQADICRADLLVEIESQAIHPMPPT
ncbi:chorismate transformation enzyme, FkbO/Hyg5 family [Hydrogenophaga sp.]|uniref:chorismate transformation enzyme, FkbO/Hyg5 family n=1 Tax=Hydrogenophaga sp. TaxID=1904254 RepID=UPI002FCB7B97